MTGAKLDMTLVKIRAYFTMFRKQNTPTNVEWTQHRNIRVAPEKIRCEGDGEKKFALANRKTIIFFRC